MNTHFKLQVIKHQPYKIAEKMFNSNIQMNRQNHVGMHTVYIYIYIYIYIYMCVCVCVCVCVSVSVYTCVCVCVCVCCVSQCVLLYKFSN